MAISSFQGLNTAVKGLSASQLALDTIGHNIANASTPGYSRQVAALGATNPTFTPNSAGQVLAVGTGVDVSTIVGIRESYIMQQLWEQGSNYAFSETAVTFGRRIEDWFNEPSEYGLQATLNKVWNAIQSLATDASQSAQRQTLRAAGRQLCDYVDSTFQNMQRMVTDLNTTIGIKVDAINRLTKDISDLNTQISAQELTGIQANDLRDRRDVLVTELAALVNVSVVEDKTGKYVINCSGQALVTAQGSVRLATVDDATSRLSTYYGIITNKIVATDSGNTVNVSSGEVASLLFMRDNPDYGITAYLDRVDSICRSQLQDFNRQHRMGYTLDGTTNVNFYGNPGVNYDLENSAVLMSNLAGGQININSRTAYIANLQTVEVKIASVGAGGAVQSVAFTVKDKNGNILSQGTATPVTGGSQTLQDANGNNLFILPNGLEVSINVNDKNAVNDTYSFDLPSQIVNRWQPAVTVPSGVAGSSVPGSFSMMQVNIPNTAVSFPNLLVGFKDNGGTPAMYVSIDGGNSWSAAVDYDPGMTSASEWSFDLSRVRAQGLNGASYGLAGEIRISKTGSYPSGFDPTGNAQLDKTYAVNVTNNVGGWIGKMKVNPLISDTQNGLRTVAAADIATTFTGNAGDPNALGGKMLIGSTAGYDGQGKPLWPPKDSLNLNILPQFDVSGNLTNISLKNNQAVIGGHTYGVIPTSPAPGDGKVQLTTVLKDDPADSTQKLVYTTLHYWIEENGSDVERYVTFTVRVPKAGSNQNGDTYNMLFPPGSANGNNAFAMGVLIHNTPIAALGKATINDYYNTVISDIGNQVNTQTNLRDTQQKVLLQITNWRDSVSGVNMDEEMANLIKFQRAYGASAKMVTTINELIGTLLQAV
ncbi:MAG: flagellar hook-associated protein FlgK [Negativicutes bacterium]|nr:flagellar hook-associated protein FlgK [Negativicutes bacterium]